MTLREQQNDETHLLVFVSFLDPRAVMFLFSFIYKSKGRDLLRVYSGYLSLKTVCFKTVIVERNSQLGERHYS